MANWFQALARTRAQFVGRVQKFFGGKPADAETLEELEECLLRADVPSKLVSEFLAEADRGAIAGRTTRLEKLLVDSLKQPAFHWAPGASGPRTILVVGVNGSGKTTTCAKLARLAAREGRKPLLAAADTFRAAGSDQMKLWAERLGCEVVAGRTGADAAAVAYDAIDAAMSRQSDILIVDTAGRMHTKQPLLQELRKIRRSLDKRCPGSPEETWIVLDASIGQNAVQQARVFHDAVPLTGVVVTKLDGSSKAGFLFSIARELSLPVLYAGLGEGADDLAPFDRDEFVKALLGDETPHG